MSLSSMATSTACTSFQLAEVKLSADGVKVTPAAGAAVGVTIT